MLFTWANKQPVVFTVFEKYFCNAEHWVLQKGPSVRKVDKLIMYRTKKDATLRIFRKKIIGANLCAPLIQILDLCILIRMVLHWVYFLEKCSGEMERIAFTLQSSRCFVFQTLMQWNFLQLLMLQRQQFWSQSKTLIFTFYESEI